MKLKVLVVDDSAFMRLLLSDILSEDKELEVVGSAADGKEAVTQVMALKPDLVLLDMNMGEYDGLYAVEHIMKKHPVPILILSAVGNTDLEPIFDALRLGAVDYMNKPVRNNSKLRSMDMELIRKIKSAARAKPTIQLPQTKPVATVKLKPRKKRTYDIIVIGASTGGPTAIENVITAFPSNLDVPVLIGQHMPANFIQPFVDRLNKLSPLDVKMGVRGMVPRPGSIIIAPGDRNMVVTCDKSGHLTIDFSDEVFREYNNPSINALMLSVADSYGSKALGAILTGMGKDGVKGLSAIKAKGGHTVAQDKATSVIYGMPKVAYDSGAVSDVLSIKEIGSFLVSKL
ncbi:MAG: chemotaxis-specific protein-glutamate methyltransferase CheB [Bacteroidota bacterium]